MDEYRYPETFSELVEMMTDMPEDMYWENDDTGHLRRVELIPMETGNYAMFEDHEFIGTTFDVVSAAQFIAEGWEAYEHMEHHE